MWNTVLCPATLSGQPTEAVPAWGRLISSRCATPTSARISTVTRGRSSATLGTLALNSTATSTTGCLMNTQTVSAHQHMERGWSSLVNTERGCQKTKDTSLRKKKKPYVMIHCGSCKYEWKPKRGSKHIILECGSVLEDFIYRLCLLWSLPSGCPAESEYSFELWLRPPIKTPSLWKSL